MPGVKWLELHAFHLSRLALPGRDDRVGYSGPKPSALTYLDRRGPRAWSGWVFLGYLEALRNLAYVLLSGEQEDPYAPTI
jgi:hypothetical protein